MNQAYKVKIDADLEEIMPRYLEIRHKELEELEEALDEEDTERVRMLGHRLKGTGSSYGLDELTEIGTTIEDIAKEGSIKGIQRQTERLRHILENLQIEYEEM